MDDEISALKWLVEQWTGKMVRILESMTDQRPTAVWDEGSLGQAAALQENSLVWEQSVDLFPEPAIWIAAPEATWLDLGSRTLHAAGIEDVEPADARNTWLEVLNQSLAGLVQEIGRRLQTEVSCDQGREISEISSDPLDLRFTAIQIDYGDGALPPLLLGFSPALLEKLDAAGRADRGVIADETNSGAETPVAHPGPQASAISKTFDLLLDVGLPISISFGRTQLPIRDVLKLTTGSIVELNRTVSEPVEVIVNDCVIARGEVVVVEGNYGVRIRQIISRQDRLRTGTGSAQRAKKGAAGLAGDA